MKQTATQPTFTTLKRTWLTLALSLLAATLTACITPPTPDPLPPDTTTPENSSGNQTGSAEPDINDLIRRNDTAGLQALFRGRDLVNTAGVDGNYPLHSAVLQGSAQTVELLLVMGAQPDPLDAVGRTPLRLALDKSDVAISSLLARRQVSLFVPDSSGVTPLDIAIARNLSANILLAQNINTVNAAGQSVLHVAVERMSLSTVRVVLGLQPSLNALDAEGKTALDTAFLYPNNPASAAIAEQLVLQNASSSFDDFTYFIRAVRDTNHARVRFTDGASVLHEAVRFDHRGYLQFFLDRAVPVDTRDAGGGTALHTAMRLGQLEAAAILVAAHADANALDSNGNAPLHLALASPAAEQAARLLIAAGADPSIKDRGGNTAPHLAVQRGYAPELLQLFLDHAVPVDSTNAEGDSALLLAVRNNRANLVEPLIRAGASVFLKNSRGQSALGLAFTAGADNLRILMTHANREARDERGDTPYHFAMNIEARPESILLLAELGFNPSIRNNDGDTALHLATRYNQRAQGEALLQVHADPFVLNTASASPLALALNRTPPLAWFFTPTIMTLADSAGNGPLHYAALAGLPDGIGFLVGMGAVVDAKNNDGRTPLMTALRNDSVAAVRALMALGASVTSRDASGSTPLHLAVHWAAMQSLRTLLEISGTANPRDFTGKTPLRDAIDRSDLAMVTVLLDNQADIFARDVNGETALHAAARNADARLLAKLLETVELPDVRDDAGVTPLLRAAYSENSRAAALLVAKGGSIHARDAAGESPLSFAIKRSDTLLQALLTPHSIARADSSGHSVLRVAIDLRAGLGIIELLLAKGAPLDDRDAQGISPLHVAVITANWPLVSLLAAAGADPFMRDVQGRSPASIALTGGANAITNLFGKTPDIHDPQGDTALHYAAATGLDRAAATLLELGANPLLVNVAGETAYAVARRRGHQTLVDLLAPFNPPSE